jgi:hypothetical protein
MHPVDTEIALSPDQVAIDFDCGVQELAALEAAAYRLLGQATCRINKVGERFVCCLVPDSAKHEPDLDALKLKFLQIVTDENVRHRLAVQMQGTRNIILALAFGSLANE